MKLWISKGRPVKDMNKENTYEGKEEIIELFSQYDFIIKDIDIVEQEYLTNIYIVVSDVDTYRINTVESIIQKIKNMKEELIKREIIEDIVLGDLYKGNWRILIYFKEE